MCQMVINGQQVEVVRKEIRNLHLGVYPPNGRVRVAAPRRVSDEAVRLAVVSKLGWIKRQQAKFAAQPRQSRREFVSGESHYFLGTRYRLNVVEYDGPPQVISDRKTILSLRVRPGATVAQRELILNRWYRRELRALIAPLLEKLQPIMGVQVTAWGVKQMKTRWGSCNTRAGGIWLNLELAKKPEACIEFVVVHELAHLLERHHNDRFSSLMDRFIPQWRLLRAELNKAPLGHAEWGY